MNRYSLIFSFMLTLFACQSNPAQQRSRPFDWQGHRGARGLVPENSIPAMQKALSFPLITTLEMDVAITKDSQVVLSHEPWLSAEICSDAQGNPITEADTTTHFLIYQHTYAELSTFDCGKRGHPRFPQQQPMPVHKPTLAAVVAAVNAYCKTHNRPQPAYNIEIKSQPEWDDVRHPAPAVFARLLLQDLKRLGIAERTCIQSFDVRSLQAVRAQAPAQITALLVENTHSIQENVKLLGFTPTIYSCDYTLLQPADVAWAHQQGMQVIPWTVNEVPAMQTLVNMNVDGIITDYPNLAFEVQ